MEMVRTFSSAAWAMDVTEHRILAVTSCGDPALRRGCAYLSWPDHPLFCVAHMRTTGPTSRTTSCARSSTRSITTPSPRGTASSSAPTRCPERWKVDPRRAATRSRDSPRSLAAWAKEIKGVTIRKIGTSYNAWNAFDEKTWVKRDSNHDYRVNKGKNTYKRGWALLEIPGLLPGPRVDRQAGLERTSSMPSEALAPS